MSEPIPLYLTVKIETKVLRVQIENPSDQQVRVWDLGNSWGGDSWSLRLTVDGAARRQFTWRPANQVYTRNLPRFIEVPAHGQKELRLFPGGYQRTVGEDLAPVRGVPIHVQVVLEIAPSPEAKKHTLATGHLESDKVLSQPPHTWLFGLEAVR